MRRYLLAILILLSSSAAVTAGGKDPYDLGHASRFRLGLNFQFTSFRTWQIDFGCHYMVTPWLGLGASLGGWRQYGQWNSPEGPNWWVLKSDRHVSNVFLRPSLLLTTPTLWRIGKTEWGLMANPGVMLNVPNHRVTIEKSNDWDYEDQEHISSSRGKWCALDCRLGLYLRAGKVYIMAGYILSNLEIYSYYRNMEYDGVKFSDYYPRRKGLQGGFVTISYNF